MSVVDNLYKELRKNLKKSSDYIESLEKKTGQDRENLKAHLVEYKEQLKEEQERRTRLINEANKEKEAIVEQKKKLNVGRNKDPKSDPAYYESRQKLLMDRIAGSSNELRQLNETISSNSSLEVPEQDRRDQLELNMYIKYTQLDITATDNDNELRFTYHALNQTDPNEECIVTLLISPEHEYKVTGCSPDIEEVYQLADKLNQSRELYHFVARARQAFINSIDQQ